MGMPADRVAGVDAHVGYECVVASQRPRIRIAIADIVGACQQEKEHWVPGVAAILWCGCLPDLTIVDIEGDDVWLPIPGIGV